MGEATRLFGTDGIRGVANRHPMTAETALAVGRAVAAVARDGGADRRPIVIGKDPRRSSDMLLGALAAGAMSAGRDVVSVGTVTTPGLAFLVRRCGAAAGIMVSASHNPFEDNGIKVFSSEGTKLSEAAEREIEARVSGGVAGLPSGRDVGTLRSAADAVEEYAAFVARSVEPGDAVAGMSVVLDCANGSAAGIAPNVFARLGVRVLAIGCEPDGVNINAGCGSEHPEHLAEVVRASRADAGLAFDGDGDRLIAVDENGATVTGDPLIAIFARFYRDAGRLAGNAVVTTVMSNFGLGVALRAMGVRHVTCAVGDRHVREAMEQAGAVVGGEDSGHIILLDRHCTGDGILSGVQLLAAMRGSGLRLSELASVMKRCPQRVVNVSVARKPPLEGQESIQRAIRSAEAQLGAAGRVLVRYSGTQPLCRVMVEGPSEALTAALCESVAGAVRETLAPT